MTWRSAKPELVLFGGPRFLFFCQLNSHALSTGAQLSSSSWQDRHPYVRLTHTQLTRKTSADGWWCVAVCFRRYTISEVQLFLSYTLQRCLVVGLLGPSSDPFMVQAGSIYESFANPNYSYFFPLRGAFSNYIEIRHGKMWIKKF